MPHIVHFHGKFYRLVKGEEPGIPYEQVIRVLVQGGFAEWLSAEFEGGDPAMDSFEMIQEFQAMIRRYISRYSKA